MAEGEACPYESLKYDLAIIGKPLDDRGRSACKFAKNAAKKVIEAEYISENLNFLINDKDVEETEAFIDNLRSLFEKKKGRVLIEATTLSFSEIFLSIYALLLNKNIEVNFLYIEPGEYKKKEVISKEEKSISEAKKRGHDLSEEQGDFSGIPYAGISTTSDNIVKQGLFFLGFEGYRFERIFEEYDGELQVKEKPVVFGVPPFKAGWELNSFSANIKVLDNHDILDGSYFCAANNPYAAYQIVKDVYETLNFPERMFVAPLGTKPEGIGVAAFIAEKSLAGFDGVPHIGVIYDHPKKKKGRSSDISKWHLYEMVH